MALILFSFACSKDEDKEDCSTLTVCTNEFRSIVVSVKNSSGESVRLDRYKVILGRGNKDIAPELTNFDGENFGANGAYVIFNDSYRLEFQNSTTNLKFIGIIDSQEIITTEFVVGADCCHVSLVSGDTYIVLN